MKSGYELGALANRLLIVEDDRDLARNLIEYLELQGYVTDFAADGQTALQLSRPSSSIWWYWIHATRDRRLSVCNPESASS